jgi:Fic family protein
VDYQETLERITAKKAELDRLRPLPPAVAAKLKEYFDVEWTYHSNAIEGSSVTLAETKVILADGLTVGGKPLREHLEVINHKHAIDLVEALAAGHEPLTEHSIRQIHALILRTINDGEAGRYHRVSVRVTGSNYVPPDPSAVPPLMHDFGLWLNSQEAQALHPVELAALAHSRLVDIHPFVDGNGRTARLLMNLILLSNGYPLAIIRNEDRSRYYDLLEKAHQGETDDFVEFVALAVDRTLDIYLDSFPPGEAS